MELTDQISTAKCNVESSADMKMWDVLDLNACSCPHTIPLPGGHEDPWGTLPPCALPNLLSTAAEVKGFLPNTDQILSVSWSIYGPLEWGRRLLLGLDAVSASWWLTCGTHFVFMCMSLWDGLRRLVWTLAGRVHLGHVHRIRTDHQVVLFYLHFFRYHGSPLLCASKLNIHPQSCKRCLMPAYEPWLSPWAGRRSYVITKRKPLDLSKYLTILGISR
jgi:hypothetical protein